jgi:hypothetical protein|tara:strand:- start:23719 stop:24267 length:549 start_codon:yes stop_codon:yes gene_type:complete
MSRSYKHIEISDKDCIVLRDAMSQYEEEHEVEKYLDIDSETDKQLQCKVSLEGAKLSIDDSGSTEAHHDSDCYDVTFTLELKDGTVYHYGTYTILANGIQWQRMSFLRYEGEFLVALECGGIMEDPKHHYQDYQIIKANSEEKAVEEYNKKNKCDFYYGYCFGVVEDGTVTIDVDILIDTNK